MTADEILDSLPPLDDLLASFERVLDATEDDQDTALHEFETAAQQIRRNDQALLALLRAQGAHPAPPILRVVPRAHRPSPRRRRASARQHAPPRPADESDPPLDRRAA
jgi:hypothetical protein